jgi:hypothetical protein
MTAQLNALPGEDEAEFRRHVEGFLDALAPRDAVERALAEQAALAVWKIRRAERAECARVGFALRAAEATADRPAQDEVAAMGHWLTTQALRPRQDAGKSLFPFLSEDRHDPFGRGRGEPRHIVLRLEATAAGCRWLLEQRARLGRLLERGYDWRTNELILALQLRGQRPMGLDVLEWQGVLEPIPADGNHEAVAVARRGMLIQFAGGLPADPAERRAALLGLVHEEVARLEQREADHERRAAADRVELAARLSVDATAEGERMRRYQLDCDRKLHRALNGLRMLRRDEDRGIAGDPAPEDDPGPEPEPVGTVERESGPADAAEGAAAAAVRPETEGDNPAGLHSAFSLQPSQSQPVPPPSPRANASRKTNPRSRPPAINPRKTNPAAGPATIPPHESVRCSSSTEVPAPADSRRSERTRLRLPRRLLANPLTNSLLESRLQPVRLTRSRLRAGLPRRAKGRTASREVRPTRVIRPTHWGGGRPPGHGGRPGRAVSSTNRKDFPGLSPSHLGGRASTEIARSGHPTSRRPPSAEGETSR